MEEDGCIQVKKVQKMNIQSFSTHLRLTESLFFSGASLQNSFAAFSYTPEGAADLFKNV